MRILSFGSLNIDYVYQVNHFVHAGETLSSTNLSVFTGGKGLNQSVALAKAGANVVHAGAIGRDGAFLLDTLSAAGVDISCVKVLPSIKTGHAVIQNERDGENCILLYGGANQAVTEDLVDEVLSSFCAGDWIVLQNEISCLSYIVEKAHEKGILVILNPSPMNEKVLRLPLDLIDCFILNEIEAGQILGSEGTAEEMIRGLKERFPKAVIVLTLGKNGSWYLSNRNSIRQCSYEVKAVDTTAAGDTFTGFFLGSLSQGRNPKLAMELAAKAAALAVTKQGAAPSIPTMEEVLSERQWKEREI